MKLFRSNIVQLIIAAAIIIGSYLMTTPGQWMP